MDGGTDGIEQRGSIEFEQGFLHREAKLVRLVDGVLITDRPGCAAVAIDAVGAGAEYGDGVLLHGGLGCAPEGEVPVPSAHAGIWGEFDADFAD